jgi:hypothetical protein
MQAAAGDFEKTQVSAMTVLFNQNNLAIGGDRNDIHPVSEVEDVIFRHHAAIRKFALVGAQSEKTGAEQLN